MTVVENGLALENMAMVQAKRDMVTATSTGPSGETQQRANTTMPADPGHEATAVYNNHREEADTAVSTSRTRSRKPEKQRNAVQERLTGTTRQSVSVPSPTATEVK
ncbi:hypothetical protein DVH05_027652 [Phytophthora capsici]|nr:hypothetical protein DVH05_027652 [Phytophthora capsici]